MKLKRDKNRVYFQPDQVKKDINEVLYSRKNLSNYKIRKNPLMRS